MTTSPGETDLGKLLATLEAEIRPGDWVFEVSQEPPVLETEIMAFREKEGWTMIRPARADDCEVWAWIEITTHSSLQAIGFLAKIAEALASAGISCNAVAGVHHDHVFVQAERAQDALAAILGLRSVP